MEIPIDRILPNPDQPRTIFDEADLEQLSESIAEHGVIQPVTVERADNGFYILHDGERRWRASKLAGKTTIPAYIERGLNGAGSRDRLVRAMVANIQRADLNPVEEGHAYQQMIDEHGMTVSQIVRTIGISQPRVNSRLKLLELDESIQAHIISGRLPKDERSTNALLSIEEPETRQQLADRAAARRMTVKAIVEACVRLNDHIAADKAPRHPVPAVHMATRREPINRQRWDALTQIGKLPPWILVEISTRDTCRQCSWCDQASEVICKLCPLPQMLAAMIGRAN